MGKKPLAVTAYEQIYRKIITLEYKPGSRLEEKFLMDALDIGRTPVREALQRLAADFMVDSQHSKGFIVRPITLQNTKSSFEALKILELGVAGLAVKQENSGLLSSMTAVNEQLSTAFANRDTLGLVECNSLFHQYFSQCSGNDYLIHALYKVRCEANRLAYLSYSHEIDPFASLQEHYQSVVEEHSQMIRFIRNGKASDLKTVINNHIQAFQERIVRYMSSGLTI